MGAEPRDGGWITVTWKHLDGVPAPFGELAWDHARQQVRDQGGQAAETEISGAVAALLKRASDGPARDDASAGKPSRRDRRVVARTRATAAQSWPRPDPPVPPQPVPASPVPADADDTPVAEVVPLPVFDARQEAERWW